MLFTHAYAVETFESATIHVNTFLTQVVVVSNSSHRPNVSGRNLISNSNILLINKIRLSYPQHVRKKKITQLKTLESGYFGDRKAASVLFIAIIYRVSIQL